MTIVSDFIYTNDCFSLITITKNSLSYKFYTILAKNNKEL